MRLRERACDTSTLCEQAATPTVSPHPDPSRFFFLFFFSSIFSQVTSLQTAVADALAVIDLPTSKARLTDLEIAAAAEDLWDDRPAAERLLRAADAARTVVAEAERLAALLDDAAAAAELACDASDPNEAAAFVREGVAYAAALDAALAGWELTRLLGGEWDGGDAVLTVQSGAGGTEAQDWAAMLERMYTRWAGAKGFSVRVLDRAPGEEAGIKSVELEIHGACAYGLLSAERGTHRLVRQSPFNAKSLRQTSFASVEVMPVLGEEMSEWRHVWVGARTRARASTSPNLHPQMLTRSHHPDSHTQPTTWSPPLNFPMTTSR